MNHPIWNALLIFLFVVSILAGLELLFFFAVLMGLASLASRLWMRYCLAGVTYDRELGSTHLAYGDETTLSIQVANAKPLPLAWLQVVDGFPEEIQMLTPVPRLEGDDGPLRALSNLMSLSWYERVRRTYRIKGSKRGEFAFGPADVSSGDIFGFYRRAMVAPETDKIIVYPRVVPVSEFGLQAAWPLVEQKTQYRLLEDPLRVASIREYVPGDSYRHIHWKATARLQKLQTKVFDPGASPVVLLFMDVQTRTNPYGLDQEYLEMVISATASVAIHALGLKRGVGLYTNGGIGSSSRCARISASRNVAQATKLLEILARVDEFRQMPMSTLLYREMATIPYGATIVAISALPTDDLLAALLQTQMEGHPVTLLTVGEEPIQAPAKLSTHHLGGRDVWRRLATFRLD